MATVKQLAKQDIAKVKEIIGELEQAAADADLDKLASAADTGAEFLDGVAAKWSNALSAISGEEKATDEQPKSKR